MTILAKEAHMMVTYSTSVEGHNYFKDFLIINAQILELNNRI